LFIRDFCFCLEVKGWINYKIYCFWAIFRPRESSSVRASFCTKITHVKHNNGSYETNRS
jgi:hypothetical protein